MLTRLPAYENQDDRASESARQGSKTEEEERHCRHRGSISSVFWSAPNGDAEPAKEQAHHGKNNPANPPQTSTSPSSSNIAHEGSLPPGAASRGDGVMKIGSSVLAHCRRHLRAEARPGSGACKTLDRAQAVERN
jgi:hypothetical protein